MTSRAGIVLAGGFGERFDDGDKTLAELDGRPLIAHAIEPLRPVVDTVVVSCREEQIEAFQRVLEDVTYRPDPTPDEGPLAGLAAAVSGVDAEAVAVATADRPCVSSELYTEFFDALSLDGVVIQSGEFREPAPAVFRVDRLRSVVQRHRDAGDRRLRAVLDCLDLTTVSAESAREQWGETVLVDVNTRAELDSIRK